MYYHRYIFLSLAALMMPLSASGACRSDFSGYVTQLQGGNNQQIEDAISSNTHLYIDTICSSSGVKVFSSTQTDTFQIFSNDSNGWRCETKLNMFILRGSQSNPKVLIYDFPAGKEGNVVVTGCHTPSF